MTITVGVIGLGVGEAHVEAAAKSPHCASIVVCDLSEEKCRAVAAKYAKVRIASDASAIINDTAIDAVCIASYDDVHCEQVVNAARAGKHIFVEKPICQTREEAQLIRGAIEEMPDIKFSSNLILRQFGRFAEVKKRIAAGLFGALYFLSADYNFGRIHKLLSGWRSEIDYYSIVGGGGIHMVDLMLWFAESPVVEVSAMSNKICTQGTAFNHDDLVIANLRFESGVLGRLGANFGCVHPHYHAVEVYGTKASFVNGREQAIWYQERESSGEIMEQTNAGVAKGVLFSDFIDCIVERREPIVCREDVFSAMSVCLAVEESVREGSPVTVRYV